MAKEIHDSKGISRRAIMRGAVTLAGLAASLTAGEAGAQTKLTHAVTKYQDTPKNGQKCSTCINFEPPAACKIVVSPISPNGWCQFYAAKKPA
jgi:hypothetical protein